MREDRNHDPRNKVSKDLSLDSVCARNCENRIDARFNKVNSNHASMRAKHPRRNLDNSRESRRVTWYSGAVAGEHAEMLGSVERTCQRLMHGGRKRLVIVALLVKPAIEMIACVRIPASVSARV